jgi:putative ABC transport system permease protein
MKLALAYALRDLRGALSSFRIVLLCLILGVGTIAAVQFASRNVLDGVKVNGRSLLGADLIVRNIYTPAPDAVRTWFKDRNAVLTETIETRAMLANAQTQDNTLVELKAVTDGYPQFGSVETDAGGHLHDLLKGKSILLDPALRERLGLKTGDTVKLGTLELTVRGFITHEPDRAGSMRFGIAPRAMVSRQILQSSGLIQPGSMLYYHLRAKLPDGTNLKLVRDELETSFPQATWRITDADNASPGITKFVNRLMLFLTLVGLSALLIGGIGIGNGTRAHFESRMKTIAIFKSLGAPIRLIEKIYFIQIALIAFIGTGIGILIGSFVPYFLTPIISQMVPFPVDPRISFLGLAVPALFGFMTCFAFSLWPLGQAAATSPLDLFRSSSAPIRGTPAGYFRTAIVTIAVLLGGLAVYTAQDLKFALWFIGGALACLIAFWGMGWLISQMAGRIKAPHHPALRLGLRNLYRPGNATANTLISLGLGLTVMVSVTLIEMNLSKGIASNLPKDAPAFFFLDIQPDQKDGFEKLLLQQETANTLIFSPNLRGRIVSVNGVPAAEAIKDKNESWLLQNDRGFTYTKDLPAHSEITAGEWWPADYKGPPLVSVVDDVERAFGVKPGDMITVNILGRDITAKIANIRSVNWMNMTINYAVTFAPGALEKTPHSWLATVVADPSAEAKIQRVLGASYPNVSMIRLSETIKAATDVMNQIAVAVRVTATIAILTGILVLSGSLAATRTQRLYDVVVLKVLGIRNATLKQSFLFEFGLLGLFAGVIAVGLGSIVSWAVMKQLMDLGWQLYAGPAIATGLAGIGLTILIGWAITGRILSSPAAPHLRND